MSAAPIAGRYELVAPIQAGGMGQVWRGYDAVLDREVAVKLIRPDVITGPEQADEFAKRFRREARLTARIGHHGVPQVYDAVLDAGYDRVYLVMELVTGTPLRAFIDPDSPLPTTWATALAAQIATVLSHAHAVPAVHRDLKPDNVLVTDRGAIKVIDFGIAAILRSDITRLTATGSPIGTTRYMSPEQIQGGQVTPRSDLYALGCLLHELLAGTPMANGDNEFTMMQQHVAGVPTPVRTLRPDVPEPLERLILDLLAKTPDQRPADAYEVYQRLLPLLPPPAAAPPQAAHGPAGMPDPTLLYRQPNAPLPRPQAPTPAHAAADLEAPAVAPPADTRLNDAITAAVAQSDALLEDERFTQAAEVLQAVVEDATAALGADNPRVLRLRARHAAILVLGGDYHRALPEFDTLVEAYRRTAGPTSEQALNCLRQAAHCRAELGHTTTALQQFQQVLAHIRGTEGDASATALDLRRNIGILLLAEGHTAQAADVLQPLRDDLDLVYGSDHPDTQEIADILARLHLATPPVDDGE